MQIFFKKIVCLRYCDLFVACCRSWFSFCFGECDGKKSDAEKYNLLVL